MVVFEAFRTGLSFDICVHTNVFINIELCFGLDILALRFALASNFESVPRFAEFGKQARTNSRKNVTIFFFKLIKLEILHVAFVVVFHECIS